MPTHRTTRHAAGCIVHWWEYSPKEIKQAWNENGQEHTAAIERGSWCVVTPCTEEEAINICSWFVHDAFACPTCTHYDGKTVSLYCGDAGSNAPILKKITEVYIKGYLGPKPYKKPYKGKKQND